jgi:hypothetical protein
MSDPHLRSRLSSSQQPFSDVPDLAARSVSWSSSRLVDYAIEGFLHLASGLVYPSLVLKAFIVRDDARGFLYATFDFVSCSTHYECTSSRYWSLRNSAGR